MKGEKFGAKGEKFGAKGEKFGMKGEKFGAVLLGYPQLGKSAAKKFGSIGNTALFGCLYSKGEKFGGMAKTTECCHPNRGKSGLKVRNPATGGLSWGEKSYLIFSP